MDAVVFQQSPLADYLEGQGTDQEVWPDLQNSPSSTASDQPSYAPRGLARLRGALPSPLRVQLPVRGYRIARARAKSRLEDLHRKRREDEQFLEQFRYLIVASQLLTDQISTLYHHRSTVSSSASRASAPPSQVPGFSLTGAVVAALSPFLLAWIGQWSIVRAYAAEHIDWRAWVQVCVLFVTTVVGIYIYSCRKFVKRVRFATLDNLSTLVTSSQAFDSAITTALNFIQEVEIVSRGYELTTPLPPISRIEERTQQRRCIKLRRELAVCLVDLSNQYIEAHRALTPYAAEDVVEQYHDIYDVSRKDFQEVGLLSPQPVSDDQASLKSLKLSFAKQYVSRKVVLCDLLAFSASHDESDLKRWHIAIEEMHRLCGTISSATSTIQKLLQVEEKSDWSDPEPDSDVVPEPLSDPSVSTPARQSNGSRKDQYRAQVGRLSSLAQGIRTLGAKMHLFKEQTNEALKERSAADVSAILTHQYDSLGTDLKQLLSEWEHGKNLMTMQAENHQRTNSRASNRFSRSPLSPTQSLGGLTAVEGSPSDALRRLGGEDEDSDRTPPDQLGSEDEVFEAISVPKQRSTLSREEKLAKMKEDRLKRALVQDKSDANTHMLRELETVIKHRPRGRTTTRDTTV